jgi:hypothetical protein
MHPSCGLAVRIILERSVDTPTPVTDFDKSGHYCVLVLARQRWSLQGVGQHLTRFCAEIEKQDLETEEIPTQLVTHAPLRDSIAELTGGCAPRPLQA